MKKFLAAIAIAALAIAPVSAGAHDPEEEAAVPLTDADPSLPTLYLDADGPGVWEETNGDEGLQTQSHSHGQTTIPADTQLI